MTLSAFIQAATSRIRRVFAAEALQLALLSVVVGAAAAYAAIGFRLAIGGIQWLFFQEFHEQLYTTALALPWWQVLLAPAVGGLAVGLFIRYVMPERRPLVVADVMEAAALKDGVMSLRRGIAAAAANAASIGCGASVGREGPVVHLGASLASTIGKRFNMSRGGMLTLLGCGVASAVAASFNAPLAGALFALEVVVGHYRLRAFAPVVVASVIGTIVSRSHYGAFPAFIKPHYEIVSVFEFPAFALLGVACAVAAVVLMASIMVVSDAARRVPGPIWLRPAVAGLLVGAIALVYPQVLGVGYEATDITLKGGFSFWVLFGLIVAKTGATAISLGGGFGGGVFSPSLVLGGVLGAAFGAVAAGVFPDLASERGAYSLVGMGALAGAVLGAPISTILIVFELTGDYEVTLAVMIAVVIASLLTQATIGKSFFQWQLERRGIVFGLDAAQLAIRRTTMAQVMRGGFSATNAATTLADARRMLRVSPDRSIWVIGEAGEYRGVVATSDPFAVSAERTEDGEGEAGAATVETVMRSPPFLVADDNLRDAVDLFSRATETALPVVEDRESMRLAGVVVQRDVMVAYDRAHRQARE